MPALGWQWPAMSAERIRKRPVYRFVSMRCVFLGRIESIDSAAACSDIAVCCFDLQVAIRIAAGEHAVRMCKRLHQ
jgi:hypothetical protein